MVFVDRFGRLQGKLTPFLQISRIEVQPYLIARAVLYPTTRTAEAREKFPFNTEYLNIVVKLDQLEKTEQTT